MKRIRKKFIFIIAAILLLIISAIFIWQNFKNKIVGNTLSAKVSEQTDSLYTIQYDSLSFDAVTGNAFIKNVRITPDTGRIKKLSVENMPDILLAASIKSINLTGVKTAEALKGNSFEGDSIIIENPQIILYSLKPLRKGTKIQLEANTVYKQILRKLNFIKVGFVYIKNVNASGINFFTKTKNFDCINGNLLLQDVLIDSIHHQDTSRVLFCKQAAFTVDSFFSYNHNRKEVTVKKVHFLGKQKRLLFDEISINRFENDSSSPALLLKAQGLTLNGVNSNEIVKNKNLAVDTIFCNKISVYELPLESLKTSPVKSFKSHDTTGFANVYSVSLKHLGFPKVSIISLAKSNYSTGNISIKVNDVNVDAIEKLQTHPMNFVKEAEVAIDWFSIKSKDNYYSFKGRDVHINSLQQQLNIQSFDIVPFSGEQHFANTFKFQKDRYSVRMEGISLKDINMNDLLDKKLTASSLKIKNTVAKIYHDLHKPSTPKTKVGNYPSQILQKIKLPINISKATLEDAFIEYKENETVSDSFGIVSFHHSNLNISNITNVAELIKKNNQLKISFQSDILDKIPITGNFLFQLDSRKGHFNVNAHTSAFDASVLNKVSVPMALIHIKSGKIHSIDFNISGDDSGATGNFVMKYDDLKVDVLKRDKKTKEVKKRGVASFAANLVIQNNNPGASGLRKVSPEYDRDIHKSFFNLVWKTIFMGMKETIGLP